MMKKALLLHSCVDERRRWPCGRLRFCVTGGNRVGSWMQVVGQKEWPQRLIECMTYSIISIDKLCGKLCGVQCDRPGNRAGTSLQVARQKEWPHWFIDYITFYNVYWYWEKQALLLHFCVDERRRQHCGRLRFSVTGGNMVGSWMQVVGQKERPHRLIEYIKFYWAHITYSIISINSVGNDETSSPVTLLCRLEKTSALWQTKVQCDRR